MRRMSNVQKAAETDANVARKLAHISELIVRAQEGESIAGIDYPTNMTAFRAYENSELGLYKVGSPKILDKRQSPQRLSLINEIEKKLEVLATLKVLNRRPVKKESLSTQLARLKVERDEMRYHVGRLLSKVASLLDENSKLRASARANEKSKKLTSRTIGALNKQVVELGGSLMKGVKTDD